MTINGYQHRDQLKHTTITYGLRELSMIFELGKGEEDEQKKELIEINLGKEDVTHIMRIIFKIYGESFYMGDLPNDWDQENEVITDEIEAIRHMYFMKYESEFMHVEDE